MPKEQDQTLENQDARRLDPFYGLNLFDYDNATLAHLRDVRQQFQRIPDSLNLLGPSYYRLCDEISAKRERLGNARGDYSRKSFIFDSSYVVSAVYLKLREEFISQMTEEEFYNFFKLLLKINNRRAELNSRSSGWGKNPGMPELMGPYKPPTKIGNNTSDTAVNEEYVQPPKWFKGSSRDWRCTLEIQGNFTYLLNGQSSVSWGTIKIKPSIDVGVTLKGCYPDWFSFESNQPPVLAEVKLEMDQDYRDKDMFQSRCDEVTRQVDLLQNLWLIKASRINARLEKIRRTNFQSLSSLPELILYLDSVKDLVLHDYDPNEMTKLPDKDFRDLAIEGSEAITRQIKSYFDIDIHLADSNLLALYLSKKLREAKLGLDTTNIDQVRSFLSLVIDPEADPPAGPDSIGAGGRVTNKRAGYSLRELKPLFSFLGGLEGEHIEYLKETLDYEKEDSSEMLTLFSKLLADSLRYKMGNSGREGIEKALDELRKFGFNWTRLNWQAAFNILSDRLENGNGKQIIEEVIEEIQDTEKVIAEVLPNPLDEWDVIYLQSLSKNQGKLEIVQGKTLAEREAWFDNFARRERIAIPTQPGVVIRTLNDICSRPWQDLAQRYRMEINGDEFYKEKMDRDIRILYFEDRDAKVLGFTTYRKEDVSYRKLPGLRR